MSKKIRNRRSDIDNLPSQTFLHSPPCAGETRTEGLTETLFLAPLPVYTGQPPASSRIFSEMNGTYLELGGNNNGVVAQGKILAALIWMALTTAFIAPVILCTWLVAFSPPEIERRFPDIIGDALQVFTTGSLLFILPIGVYIYGILSGIRHSAKSYPVRFNRERREVCYVDKSTKRVLITPWENVAAWISNTQGITSYGATRQYSFGIGLKDSEQDKILFFLIPQPSDAHALGMWTSIRNYMEDGVLVDTPNPMLAALGLPPTESRLKPYEGLHTFEVERDDARWMCNMKDEGADLSDKEREHYGYPKRTPWPLRRWYMWRVLSFWKMPYMLAEWAHRAGRPALPEKVTTWSNPLPEDHWAKPSPALVKANGVIKEAMDKKGATFIEACKCAGFHP